jgi:serine/threonine-protein kinase RsbW
MPLPRRSSPQDCWHRKFLGTIFEIRSAAAWIESIAAEVGLPESQVFAMQVCLEELMSNIVRYGRGSPAADCQVEPENPIRIFVTVKALADRVRMSVEDNGRPFNVAQAPAKVIDQPLDQVQPGGLGIQLIKSFASSLEYSHTETGNRVTVDFIG